MSNHSVSNGGRRNTRDRFCKHCEKRFSPSVGWQRFCSRKCGDVVRQRRRAKKVRAALRIAEGLKLEAKGNG